MINRDEVARVAAVFDELEVGQVSVAHTLDFAYVNDTAAKLVSFPPGATTAAEFAAAIRGLAEYALNRDEAAAAMNLVEQDSGAEVQSTWIFADAPTHLGVVSKPAPHPWLDGRIWAFYDNSPLAEAIDATNRANALVRTNTDAMLDPQVLAMGTRSGGRVVDLIFRDVNRATCDYLGLSRDELIGRSLVETLPDVGGVGLLARLIHCVETGEPVVLDDFPHYNELFASRRSYDIRAARAGPDLISLTWRDVTERSKLTEQNRVLTRRLQAQTARLVSELNSAARYVKSILPGELVGRVGVTARSLPSRELGGDCYDYGWIDDDHLLVYVIDVSGHGVEPALVAVSVHNTLRSGSLPRAVLLEPDQVLTELNRLFRMDQHDGNYFTIWYGVYEVTTRTLRYASAGHPPALVFTSGGTGLTPMELSTPTIPIGIFANTNFVTRTFDVPANAQILLYSDGVYELTSDSGELTSLSDFIALCTRLVQSPDWSVDTIIAELHSIIKPRSFDDDCTLVLLNIP